MRAKWLLSVCLALGASGWANGQSSPTSSTLGSNLTRTITPSNPNISTSSFSNLTSSGALGRLFRNVFTPDTASSIRRGSSTFPTGSGQTNNLRLLGPLPPINSTVSRP